MGITHRRYSGSPGIGLPRWATYSLYVDPTPSFPAGTGRITLHPITYGRPHKWAVGHTFEFSFSLPEPANKGGCPPKKKNSAGTGKTLKKATPRATNTKQRTAPDPAQAKAKRQKQAEYDRQRSQSPAAVEARLNSPATGAPSIGGTAEVGETLTSGVADEDGLDNADFTYQWQAGRLYMGRFSVGMARPGVVL